MLSTNHRHWHVRGWCVVQATPWREMGAGGCGTCTPVFKIDFGAHGLAPVCRYAFAKWHGVSRSAMKGLSRDLGRSAPFASPASAGMRRKPRCSSATETTRAWMAKFFDWRVGEHDPADGARTLARFVVKDVYLTTYCREHGSDAVSESQFHTLFREEFKRRGLRWKTDNSHGKCVECTRLRGMTKNPRLRFDKKAREARAEWEEHFQEYTADSRLYYSSADASRQAGCTLLSLCTDKATSRNTAHPNIARYGCRVWGTGSGVRTRLINVVA